MAASKFTVRASLKIAAIYAFALTSAVACSKFEVLKATTGTAKVTAEAPSVAPTSTTVSIDKVSTVYLGVDEEDETNHMWDLKLDVTHGARKLTFDVAPMLKPLVVIGRSSLESGTSNYQVEGICGNTMCSKFAVMLTVKDTTNGTSFQRVQFWNLLMNNQAPQKDLMNTSHQDVISVYESLAGEKVGAN